MFEPTVEISWPEPETNSSNELNYIITVPNVENLRPFNATTPLCVEAIERRHMSNKPLKAHRGWGGSPTVRGESRKIALAKWGLTESPFHFMNGNYARLFEASVNQLVQDSFQSAESYGPELYPKAWPYFKSAVKSGVSNYKGTFALKLMQGVTEINEPKLMDALPNMIVRLSAQTEQLNQFVPEVQRSIVRGWVELYKAHAKQSAMMATTRPFTLKEARAFVREMAKECKAHTKSPHYSVERTVYKLPSVEVADNPFQIGVVNESVQLCVRVKSYDYVKKTDAQGETYREYEAKRVEYIRKNSTYDLGSHLGEMLNFLTKQADYKLTMQQLREVKDVGP